MNGSTYETRPDYQWYWPARPLGTWRWRSELQRIQLHRQAEDEHRRRTRKLSWSELAETESARDLGDEDQVLSDPQTDAHGDEYNPRRSCR